MTRHYATTATASYLPRLKALLASMRRHCRPFRLHVLAEGEEVATWARAQDDVGVTRVETLLMLRPSLRPESLPGRPRNRNELACTWRWWFVLDLLETYGQPILAVDADVMFWGSPEPVFEEIGAAGAAVLPHAFAPAARGLPGVTQESHGRYSPYNGGFVYLADHAPAERLAELTRECAHATDHVWPSGRVTWGDQGALAFLVEEHGAHVIQHPGAAPGPWNIHTQELRRAHDGALFFGGRPLVAFHYHAFRPHAWGSFLFTHDVYEVTEEQKLILGVPYRAALAEAGG